MHPTPRTDKSVFKAKICMAGLISGTSMSSLGAMEEFAGLLHKTDRMRRLYYQGTDAMTYQPMGNQGVSQLNLSHPIGPFYTIHFTPRQTYQSDEGVIHTHTHKATLTRGVEA